MEATLDEVGTMLRHMRERQRATLQEVAHRAGLSYSFVAAIERGEKQPSLETLQRLADVYGHKVTVKMEPIPA